MMFFPGNSRADDPKAAEQVRLAFAGYREAVLKQKGADAVGYVTAGTLQQYQTFVDLALDGRREELEKLTLMNRMQVLMMRSQVPAEILRKATGRSMVIHAIDQGWIGEDGVLRTSLGDVTAEHGRATAVALSDGQPTPIRFEFREEEGSWKLDLVKLTKMSAPAFKAVLEQSKMEEDDFILQILEMVSGQRPDESIWQPVGRE